MFLRPPGPCHRAPPARRIGTIPDAKGPLRGTIGLARDAFKRFAFALDAIARLASVGRELAQDAKGGVCRKIRLRRERGRPRRRRPAPSEAHAAILLTGACRPRARWDRASQPTSQHGPLSAGRRGCRRLLHPALGGGDQAFPLCLLAGRLAMTPNGFVMLAGTLFGGLFVSAALLHFAENTFPLHPLLQNLECLLDIVVSDENLQKISNPKVVPNPWPPCGRSLGWAGRSRLTPWYRGNGRPRRWVTLLPSFPRS